MALFSEKRPNYAPNAPQDVKIAPANPGETRCAGGLLGAPAEVSANRVSPHVLFLGPLNHSPHKLLLGVGCDWEDALFISPDDPQDTNFFGSVMFLGVPTAGDALRLNVGACIFLIYLRPFGDVCLVGGDISIDYKVVCSNFAHLKMMYRLSRRCS